MGTLLTQIDNQRKPNQMLVSVERGEPGEKHLGAEKRANKLNPHMTPSLGMEAGPHWWEASALTTAPSLHPDSRYSP